MVILCCCVHTLSAVLQVIVTSAVEDRACWTPAELQEEEFVINLTEQHIAELDSALQAVQGHTITNITKADIDLPTLSSTLQNSRHQLEHGRGFALLKGLPVSRWGEDTSRRAVWAIGTHLGWAEKQDAKGSLMHDVKDHTPAADKSSDSLAERMARDKTVRGFQTNAALPFHTDGCDMFALCCLSQGKAGGATSIVSAVHVFNRIVQQRPDLAQVLQEEFHFDARGQRADGALCQVHPIYTFHEGRLNIIHKAPYIYSAQEYEGVPQLTPLQKEALEMFEMLTEDSEMKLDVELQPGECVLCSNHSMVHGRTAFEDGSASDQGTTRHMLRLWLTLPNGRPLPAHYCDTREHAASYERRIGQPHTGRVVLDGGMGRLLLNTGLPDDKRIWSATALVNPEYHHMVLGAHKQFIESGADAITTCNYAAQPTYFARIFREEDVLPNILKCTRVAVQIAHQARTESNKRSLKILGCLPPLVETHRPDLTSAAYKERGERYFRDVYRAIAKEMMHDVDAFLIETIGTEQEMLAAVDAVRDMQRPIWLSFAPAFRDESLAAHPERAADVVETVLRLVQEGVRIEYFGMNCGDPEAISAALEAIPTEATVRLQEANVVLGAYANFHDTKHHEAGFDSTNIAASESDEGHKLRRREELTEKYIEFCNTWADMGVTHIGGCCGSTPDDINSVSTWAHRHHHHESSL